VTIDFNLVSFIASIVSLILSFFAIWLAYKFKQEADRVNAKTVELLIDIRTDAKAISAYAIPELAKYGQMSRGAVETILGNMAANTHGNLSMSDIAPVVSTNVETSGEQEERSDEICR